MYFKKICLSLIIILAPIMAIAMPQKQLSIHWLAFDPLSTTEIHYPILNKFLQKYTININHHVLVQYAKVSKHDRHSLQKFIRDLEQIPISTYNRRQQLAYWINLYNVETINLILKYYPINSITSIKSGLFTRGPWDKKLLIVEGLALSLNDIEHRIIRPIWQDPRIHAALNCASMSCPNLGQTPYHGKNIDSELNNAFANFVNSPSAITIRNHTIHLSKIFFWYQNDFGGNRQAMLKFIGYYASPTLKAELKKMQRVSYQNYNWQLNQSKKNSIPQ